jgi:hypothetical protein
LQQRRGLVAQRLKSSISILALAVHYNQPLMQISRSADRACRALGWTPASGSIQRPGGYVYIGTIRTGESSPVAARTRFDRRGPALLQADDRSGRGAFIGTRFPASEAAYRVCTASAKDCNSRVPTADASTSSRTDPPPIQ